MKNNHRKAGKPERVHMIHSSPSRYFAGCQYSVGRPGATNRPHTRPIDSARLDPDSTAITVYTFE